MSRTLSGTLLCPNAFAPHASTVPSVLSTIVWSNPPDAARTPRNPAGITACFSALRPHITIVVSFLSAIECCVPAATLVTPLSDFGTLVCPLSLLPHAITLPALFTANTCAYPAAIDTMFALALLGMVIWPREFAPQPNTRPPFSATAKLVPTAISSILLPQHGGIFVWNSLFIPQVIKVPFINNPKVNDAPIAAFFN